MRAHNLVRGILFHNVSLETTLRPFSPSRLTMPLPTAA